MNRLDVFDRLQFDDQLAIDQQIQPKAFIERNTLILDGNRLLPLNQQPALFQNFGQHRLIYRFQQPRPKIPMQLQRRIDYNRGRFLDISSRLRVRPYQTLTRSC